jgi:hypothetical protein
VHTLHYFCMGLLREVGTHLGLASSGARPVVAASIVTQEVKSSNHLESLRGCEPARNRIPMRIKIFVWNAFWLDRDLNPCFSYLSSEMPNGKR